MKNRLKIGLMISSNLISNWAFKMLEKINNSNYASIELIIKEDTQNNDSNFFQKIYLNKNIIIYKLFMKLENMLYRPQPNAFKMKNLHQILPNTPAIKVKVKKTLFSDYFKDDDIKKIKSYDIDVFIRLGFRILRGEILKVPKYGVWSYHHGDNLVNRGGPPGFWEVLEDLPETGSILQILTEDLDGGNVLYRSYSTTDHLSVNRNLNNYYWKTLSFLPRKLKELHVLGADKFFQKMKNENQHIYFYSKKLYVHPRNIEALKLIFMHYFKYTLKKICFLFNFEQWILLYFISSKGAPCTSLWRFKKMVPPKGKFWADPHVIYKDDKYYIFVEEFDYKSAKGHIALITMDKTGNYQSPKKILDKPYHLSYPFIFEYKNDYFLVPESSQNKTIELYKCINFPEKWEFVMNLFEGIDSYDSTLFEKDGKWWLFANIRENAGASASDELFLFFSSNLFTKKWKSHPFNPIVSNVNSSRPAGKLFYHNNNLYRPSQNNSKSYGNGIKLNHIVTLNEKEYREVCVNSIECDWEDIITGTHTLNFVKDLTIIDAYMKRSRLSR